MKFYLQGADENKRLFVDLYLHAECEQILEVEADDFKSACEMIRKRVEKTST